VERPGAGGGRAGGVRGRLGGSWRRPVAYGIAHEADGRPAVDRVDVGEEHLPPAMVLATVTGYRSGVRAVPMAAADLDRAITLLESAETGAGSPHPHLLALAVPA
jgi:hypothetical protein